MVDNVTANAGAGGAVFRTDDVGGIHVPYGKIDLGGDGLSSPLVRGQQTTANGVPIALASDATLAVTNAGTFAAQIDGAALTALQLIDDCVYIDDADWTDDTSKHFLVGGVYQATPHTVTDGDVSPFLIDANGRLAVSTLPAGTNNIGDVDIASIAAGDNNIGNVDIVTLPALATGTNLIGRIKPEGDEYETVAASQTAQVLGPTGATGDYIAGVLVVPATTSPGNVLLLDNATSITIFTGGASSVSNLVPFLIPLGLTSVSGAWKITTGASVSCIGIGNFT